MNNKFYKNPAATASLIVIIQNKILLVKRAHEPFAGCWALPGGFLNCGQESLEQAAVRELKEETGLEANTSDLKLVCVNSEPDRDPRGHVIDHVYFVDQKHPRALMGKIKAGDDATECELFDMKHETNSTRTLFVELPPLAFDHVKPIAEYVRRIRGW